MRFKDIVAVRRAIRDKEVGKLKGMEIEAYVVGSYGEPYSEEDTNAGCDNKLPLSELEVKPGDKIDCYVYGYDRYPDEGGLVTNIEIEFGAGMEIVAVRSIEEVARAQA